MAHYINSVYVTVDGKTLDNSDDEHGSFYGDNFPFYHVHHIFSAKDGSIWFGTVNGIFKYK